MSNFVAVTLFDGRGQITLNLDLAQTISPTNYKDAKAVVVYPDGQSEPISYYVTDSYEFLSRTALERKSA